MKNKYTYKGRNIESLNKKEIIGAYKEILDCIEINEISSYMSDLILKTTELNKAILGEFDLKMEVRLVDGLKLLNTIT